MRRAVLLANERVACVPRECMVWSRDGSVKKHVGPKLKRMFFSNIRFCQRHVADQDSYLVVKFRDGRKEHIRGPCFCFEDPVIHQSITLHAAVSLNASEAIVVYPARTTRALASTGTAAESASCRSRSRGRARGRGRGSTTAMGGSTTAMGGSSTATP